MSFLRLYRKYAEDSPPQAYPQALPSLADEFIIF